MTVKVKEDHAIAKTAKPDRQPTEENTGERIDFAEHQHNRLASQLLKT